MEAYIESEIPYKVAYFTWLLAKEAVLTRENLKRRKISLCSRCYLCVKRLTVSQFFSHCKITVQLWRIFVNLRGVAWVMPCKVTHLLYSWEEAGTGAVDRDRWMIVPDAHCICWTIWKERNSRCFEDKSKGTHRSN